MKFTAIIILSAIISTFVISNLPNDTISTQSIIVSSITSEEVSTISGFEDITPRSFLN